MKKNLLFLFLLFILTSNEMASAQSTENYLYEIPSIPWDESLGNHRAVLFIDQPSDIIRLDYNWRRSDKDVEQKRFLIIRAETGDTIPNIERIEVTEEKCRLQFGPVTAKGMYYFYYLPYEVQPGYGFYKLDYFPKEKEPSSDWLKHIPLQSKIPEARIARVESRTRFDSFYPMEITATKAEKECYYQRMPAEVYLFPENRENPIRMRNNIPMKWLEYQPGKEFRGEAAPNEYFAFQIGVWANRRSVNQLSYKASTLRCGKDSIPSASVTCFNVEGTDPYGNFFKKELNVAKGQVQPLWFGVDIPSGQKAGTYQGDITIQDATGKVGTVPVIICIGGNALADRGDSEPWRHSRLRWLNSTLGIADTPVPPYTPVTAEGNTIGCLGRTVTTDRQTCLPAQINSWGAEILSKPVQFIIRTKKGEKKLKATPAQTGQTAGHVSKSWTAGDADLSLTCTMTMEFDGWMNYVYTITPKKKIEIEDIRLEIPVKNEIATYVLGMGLPGQETPREYDGKWDLPEKKVDNFGVSIPTSKEQQWLWPFDSFWIGNAHAGIHCELRGSTYSGPLLKLYRPPYPESWSNNGKGGFRIRKEEHETKAIVYSGERLLEAGKPVIFDFALIITPVKPLNMKSQFVDRYYHNGSKPAPTEEDLRTGIRIINVHQGNEYNPFINYPFLTVDKMKDFTTHWHRKGCKVKMYYTLRELSNATTEIWAIRSLGHEVLRGGRGGSFPWCREHLVTDYAPKWYEHFEYDNPLGIVADASILTSESDSRWYNYYIEGLAWMIRNLDIDGIYLDDVSYDRRILKRMRRAMDSVKPGCLIDLHSNTGFSRGPANQYAEFFPYVDKLWFGESFLYNKMTPANWLIESSGIPFGHTGDMLFQGGNPWLGMQYGMTVRYPWYTEGVNCDPRSIWKIWDEFGIADATMLGFWEAHPAVTASDPSVKVTAYRKAGKTLLSLGNYSDEKKTVSLSIDWEQLGLNPQQVKFTAPFIKNLQDKGEWNAGDPITIRPRKGWLIYVE